MLHVWEAYQLTTTGSWALRVNSTASAGVCMDTVYQQAGQRYKLCLFITQVLTTRAGEKCEPLQGVWRFPFLFFIFVKSVITSLVIKKNFKEDNWDYILNNESFCLILLHLHWEECFWEVFEYVISFQNTDLDTVWQMKELLTPWQASRSRVFIRVWRNL